MVLRADIVKAQMKVQGWSVERLADITGVSVSTVKRSLAGQDPSTAFLAGLWSRAGLSPEKVVRVLDPLAVARKRNQSTPRRTP